MNAQLGHSGVGANVAFHSEFFVWHTAVCFCIKQNYAKVNFIYLPFPRKLSLLVFLKKIKQKKGYFIVKYISNLDFALVFLHLFSNLAK